MLLLPINYSTRLISGYIRPTFKKVIEPMTGLERVDQRTNRHSGSLEPHATAQGVGSAHKYILKFRWNCHRFLILRNLSVYGSLRANIEFAQCRLTCN